MGRLSRPICKDDRKHKNAQSLFGSPVKVNWDKAFKGRGANKMDEGEKDIPGDEGVEGYIKVVRD